VAGTFERLLTGRDEPEHCGYLKARCQMFGALERHDRIEAVCAAARDRSYDDAFDRGNQVVEIAVGLALGGATEAALDLIALAMENRAAPTQTFLAVHPLLRSLHDQSRWQALVGTAP